MVQRASFSHTDACEDSIAEGIGEGSVLMESTANPPTRSVNLELSMRQYGDSIASRLATSQAAYCEVSHSAEEGVRAGIGPVGAGNASRAKAQEQSISSFGGFPRPEHQGSYTE